MADLILYGAGATGRYVLKAVPHRVLCFVDSNPEKWETEIDGVPVLSPESAKSYTPIAKWVACALSRPAAPEIRQVIKDLEVQTIPLCEVLPVCHGLPSSGTRYSLSHLAADTETMNELRSQYLFRANPDYEAQKDPSPIEEIYFPPFIKKRDDEHFVDCGAANGDTIALFDHEWKGKWSRITAFEPDRLNFANLPTEITAHLTAVGDFNGMAGFSMNGDYSSHLGGDQFVAVQKLDDSFLFIKDVPPPTYIKMDIEGSELEALWGARKIIAEYSPVLAICAYHTSEHLWQIPLLIHALNPEYKLFLRRYAEGAFELVWYAVPANRVQYEARVPATHESYSDNHEG